MKIIGLTVHGFQFRNRHQRRVTKRLDRIAEAALLDAAVKNPEVLAQVVNKFGKIQIPYEDTISTLVEKIKVKLHREAAQAILDNRRQELVSHIGELIDIVMGLNDLSGRGQYKERPFEGVTHVKQNRTSNIARRRHGMQRRCENSADESVLIRGLAMLAALEVIIDKIRTKQIRDNLEE